ncbi:hypothetical protein [Sphingomonas sp. PB1R3]|uniref:hypothetical protein n=1 Tax=Sphingomonas flavida TaxID=3096154 RepID=UPI002FCB3D25
MALWTGFANGALGVLILALGSRWLLKRFARVGDVRLAAFLFTAGLTFGRLGAATQQGDPGGRMLGIGLGLAAIGHLWWYKTASRADATERP